MPFPAGGSFENISAAAQSAANEPTGGGGSGAMGGAAWSTSNPQPGGRINIPPAPENPYAAFSRPPKDPWASNTERLKRFGHKLNTNQFNPQNSTFMRRAQNIADTVQRNQEFRRAGIGAAVRYTLGMPQQGPGVREIAQARLFRQGGTYHPSIIGQPRGGYGQAPEGPED